MIDPDTLAAADAQRLQAWLPTVLDEENVTAFAWFFGLPASDPTYLAEFREAALALRRGQTTEAA